MVVFHHKICELDPSLVNQAIAAGCPNYDTKATV